MPDEELEACWTYELARESQTLRLILKNGWHREQPRLLPDDAPLFLGGKTTVDDLRASLFNPTSLSEERHLQLQAEMAWWDFAKWLLLLEWNAWEDYLQSTSEGLRQKRRQKLEPAWTELSPIERKRFEESNRAVEWYDSGSELSSDPYLLSKPYQQLPTGRTAKSPPLTSNWQRSAESLESRKQADPRSPLRWRMGMLIHCLAGKTDDELSESFKQFAKENRPEDFSNRHIAKPVAAGVRMSCRPASDFANLAMQVVYKVSQSRPCKD